MRISIVTKQSEDKWKIYDPVNLVITLQSIIIPKVATSSSECSVIIIRTLKPRTDGSDVSEVELVFYDPDQKTPVNKSPCQDANKLETGSTGSVSRGSSWQGQHPSSNIISLISPNY